MIFLSGIRKGLNIAKNFVVRFDALMYRILLCLIICSLGTMSLLAESEDVEYPTFGFDAKLPLTNLVKGAHIGLDKTDLHEYRSSMRLWSVSYVYSTNAFNNSFSEGYSITFLSENLPGHDHIPNDRICLVEVDIGMDGSVGPQSVSASIRPKSRHELLKKSTLGLAIESHIDKQKIVIDAPDIPLIDKEKIVDKATHYALNKYPELAANDLYLSQLRIVEASKISDWGDGFYLWIDFWKGSSIKRDETRKSIAIRREEISVHFSLPKGGKGKIRVSRKYTRDSRRKRDKWGFPIK